MLMMRTNARETGKALLTPPLDSQGARDTSRKLPSWFVGSYAPSRPVTSDEWVKVHELETKLQAMGAWNPQKHDHHMLLRFLRARGWDVPKAHAMWLESLRWRAEHDVDMIMKTFHFHEREQFLAAYPHGIHKTDKLGRPVLVQQIGKVDLQKLKGIVSEERWRMWHVQEMERLVQVVFPACSAKLGRHVDQVFSLIDLKGMSVSNLGSLKNLLTMFMQQDSANYPETLGMMAIVNAPGMFRMAWGSIQGLLNADTVKKISFLTEKQLLEHIDRENLMAEYGGSSAGQLIDDIGPWASTSHPLHPQNTECNDLMGWRPEGGTISSPTSCSHGACPSMPLHLLPQHSMLLDSVSTYATTGSNHVNSDANVSTNCSVKDLCVNVLGQPEGTPIVLGGANVAHAHVLPPQQQQQPHHHPPSVLTVHAMALPLHPRSATPTANMLAVAAAAAETSELSMREALLLGAGPVPLVFAACSGHTAADRTAHSVPVMSSPLEVPASWTDDALESSHSAFHSCSSFDHLWSPTDPSPANSLVGALSRQQAHRQQQREQLRGQQRGREQQRDQQGTLSAPSVCSLEAALWQVQVGGVLSGSGPVSDLQEEGDACIPSTEITFGEPRGAAGVKLRLLGTSGIRRLSLGLDSASPAVARRIVSAPSRRAGAAVGGVHDWEHGPQDVRRRMPERSAPDLKAPLSPVAAVKRLVGLARTGSSRSLRSLGELTLRGPGLLLSARRPHQSSARLLDEGAGALPELIASSTGSWLRQPPSPHLGPAPRKGWRLLLCGCCGM